MPIDHGPAMLERLDAKFRGGYISQYEYEAKRAEVMELIRTGKTFELTGYEKGLRFGVSVLGVVLAVGILALAMTVDFYVGIAAILAMAVFITCLAIAKRIGRHD